MVFMTVLALLGVYTMAYNISDTIYKEMNLK